MIAEANIRDGNVNLRYESLCSVAVLLLVMFAITAVADTVTLSIDYTAPNATILSINETSAFAYANQSNNNFTIWYNNVDSGNFTVAANALDNNSGIVNMTWPTTVSAGGTNTTTNITSVNFTWFYSWDGSDTSNYTNQTVTVYDNASNLNVSLNNFSVILDNTAPVTTDDGPVNNTTARSEPSIIINLTAVDNSGGAGVNFTAYCVYNDSQGVCNPADENISYSNPTQVNITCTGMCQYIIRYFSSDQVGNNESVKSTNRINLANCTRIANGVTFDNASTIIGCGSVIYDSGTNITNTTIYDNSTISSSTVTNSTVNAVLFDSSTIVGSILTSSTVRSSAFTDSNMTSSAVISSSTINVSNITGSTITASILQNSTVDTSSISSVQPINATVIADVLSNGYIYCISTGRSGTAPPANTIASICTIPVSVASGGGSFVSAMQSETKLITGVASGGCGNVTFSRVTEHGVIEIQVCILKAADVKIDITPQSVTSVALRPPGILYKYMDISVANNPNITNATITFGVPKVWVTGNNLSYRNLDLYRLADGNWTKLRSEWLSENITHYKYRAFSPGLSLFAITGMQAVCPSACSAPGLWSICVNGIRNRTEYSCGIDTGFSCTAKAVTELCEPNQQCPVCPEPGEWSVCTDGVHERTEYNCSVDTRNHCIATQVRSSCTPGCPACPEPTAWSSCADWSHSRMNYVCSSETQNECESVEERQFCLQPEAWPFVVLFAILVIVAIAIINNKRKPKKVAAWKHRVGKAKTKLPKILLHIISLPKIPKHICVCALHRFAHRLHILRCKGAVHGSSYFRLKSGRKSVRSKHLHEKSMHKCTVCGRHILISHRCENCGKEVCLAHIHKFGTKFLCNKCMAKKK